VKKKFPARQQIEHRAYEVYVQRGGRGGDDMADWLAAEKELTSSDQGEAAEPSSDDHQNYGATPTILDFHGLREQPFGMTPDPAYLYTSRTHGEALASLSFGIRENRGFLALIAEPGMGKTTLLYQLLEELRDSARTVFLFQTQCDSREFLRYILHDLGLDAQGMGLVAMHSKLNELLFEEMIAGKRFVLVVDEAQNLDESVLETIRMLSNFETHNTKLLQIVLAGQPRLAANLAQPRLLQLRQRIAVLSHLEPLTVTEIAFYLEHRLKVAGHRGETLFEPNAVSLIAQRSLGIPRNINNICYHSLLVAHARKCRTVTSEIVQEALARLDIGSLAPQRLATANPMASPIAPSLPASSSGPDSAPIASPICGHHQTTTELTYQSCGRISLPRWPFRVVALAAVLLLGSLLPAMLERGGPAQANVTTSLGSPNAHWSSCPANSSNAPTTTTYSADPQDIGAGQVLTVIVRPQRSLKDLSLLYAGHFDTNLFEEICTLNPGLKDLNQLEVGQLIRIPLPPGTLRKVN